MDSLRVKSLNLRNKLNDEVTTERARERHLLYAFFAIIAVLIVLSVFIIWLIYKAFGAYTKKLEDMIAELEQANVQMLQYNYNSYHSLRTPLRNITGFLKLLSKKYDTQLDQEAREYITYVTEGVKQLSDIMVDMRRKYLAPALSQRRAKSA
jgi:chemotaxis family two-component system sensor kinase Cph1